jgi:hypothetical protein
MTANRRFSQALQALTELKTATPNAAGSNEASASTRPALQDVLAKIGTMPAGALFLGMASDGLPVLLNLFDPHPGPLLVAGDAGAGKTTFLRTVAQAVSATQDANDVQFGVVTNYPEEWEGIDAPHRAGLFPVGHHSTQEYLNALAGWAHANKPGRQCTLLLVDDLESVASLDMDSLRNFRWLLLRGPARRVWPLVTLNAARYGQVLPWLQNFRTRIFGRVANPRVAEELGADKLSAIDQLEAQVQFALRERENWLRFWLPSCLG